MSRGAAPGWEEVRREVARARAGRRAGPYLAASSVAAVVLVGAAARSAVAGLVMLLPGAILWAILRATSTPRCPACAGNLWTADDRPGTPAAPRETRVERERRCPRCGVGFE